ncbi:MAG: AmmeMemoRadiSam system protein B [bacterium]
MLRKPAVAGQFYEGEAKRLKRQLEQYIEPQAKKEEALGIMVPHAGYMYSGKVAGTVYSRITIPQTFIIIGPNHHGMGVPTAVMAEGSWETPLGTIAIDTETARKILTNSSVLKEDASAHIYEHSLEVQLPFMQYFSGDFEIVPITMRDYSQSTCQDLGEAIAKAVKESPKKIVIVASSDMTHYENRQTAEKKDKSVIEEILKLNPEGLLNTVVRNSVSMCGSGPTAVMLFACKKLGAKKATLTFYNTSGDITGDYDEVVGYAGIIVQ